VAKLIAQAAAEVLGSCNVWELRAQVCALLARTQKFPELLELLQKTQHEEMLTEKVLDELADGLMWYVEQAESQEDGPVRSGAKKVLKELSARSQSMDDNIPKYLVRNWVTKAWWRKDKARKDMEHCALVVGMVFSAEFMMNLFLTEEEEDLTIIANCHYALGYLHVLGVLGKDAQKADINISREAIRRIVQDVQGSLQKHCGITDWSPRHDEECKAAQPSTWTDIEDPRANFATQLLKSCAALRYIIQSMESREMEAKQAVELVLHVVDTIIAGTPPEVCVRAQLHTILWSLAGLLQWVPKQEIWTYHARLLLIQRHVVSLLGGDEHSSARGAVEEATRAVQRCQPNPGQRPLRLTVSA